MNNLIDRRASERLLADFKAVIVDAESLLKMTAGNGSAELGDLRAKIESSVGAARTRLHEAQDDALTRTRDAAAATGAYVHAHPWRVVGLAAGLMVIVGMLSRRS